MNIFYLDEDFERCVESMVDRHIVKMPTESMQLLSTAHRMLDGNRYTAFNKLGRKMTEYYLNDGREDTIPKCISHKHPCQIWLQKSKDNYFYVLKLTIHMCEEYRYRYGKTHGVTLRLGSLLNPPKNIGNESFSLPPQAMDKKYRHKDTITAYRQYYRDGKKHLAKWKGRTKPVWY